MVNLIDVDDMNHIGTYKSRDKFFSTNKLRMHVNWRVKPQLSQFKKANHYKFDGGKRKEASNFHIRKTKRKLKHYQSLTSNLAYIIIMNMIAT